MTDLEEPPNHSIVGWGAPIRGARVRLDEFVDDRDNPFERWYDVSANSLGRPLSWLRLCVDHGTDLYLLSPTKL